MPELAEVEHFRRVGDAVVLGRQIAQATLADDDIVFREQNALRRALSGSQVVSSHRHGKFMWWSLDSGQSIIFHFGMTGRFRAEDDAPLELAYGKGDTDHWPPKHTKLRVRTDSGRELAFTNPRRLGRVLLSQDPLAEESIARLGFDPALALPEPEAFLASLRRFKGNIKGVLLGQKFAAGIGNWMADDILWRAGISPHRRVTDLKDEEIARLRKATREITEGALAVDADGARYPAHWLFHARWKKAGTHTLKGAPIRYDTVAGRSTAWVPSEQC